MLVFIYVPKKQTTHITALHGSSESNTNRKSVCTLHIISYDLHHYLNWIKTGHFFISTQIIINIITLSINFGIFVVTKYKRFGLISVVYYDELIIFQ